MEVLALLPARSGSKRVRNKNTRLMAGRPLLAWTALAARESRTVTRLVCTTDSPEIAATAREYGCETPFLRPAPLAADDVPTRPVEKHAVWWLQVEESYRPDIIVRLQPTSPLREASDIDACVTKAAEYGACVSVEKLTGHQYQTATVAEDGRLIQQHPREMWSRRSQDVAALYTWNGAVYAAERNYWMRHDGYFGSETYAHVMPGERSADIDTMEDWRKVEGFLQRKLEGAA